MTLMWHAWRTPVLRFLTLLFASAAPAVAFGQAPEPRTPVGKTVSPTGAVLRAGADGAWAAVPPQDGVSSGDRLLALPGQRGQIEMNGLHVVLWGNLPELSTDP